MTVDRSRWWALIIASIALSGCGLISPQRESSQSLPPNTLAVPVNRSNGPEGMPLSSDGASPSAFIEDCVRYIQYGAFTGNAQLQSLLDSASDQAGLRAICAKYGNQDLKGLEELPAAKPSPAARPGSSGAGPNAG